MVEQMGIRGRPHSVLCWQLSEASKHILAMVLAGAFFWFVAAPIAAGLVAVAAWLITGHEIQDRMALLVGGTISAGWIAAHFESFGRKQAGKQL